MKPQVAYSVKLVDEQGRFHIKVRCRRTGKEESVCFMPKYHNRSDVHERATLRAFQSMVIQECKLEDLDIIAHPLYQYHVEEVIETKRLARRQLFQ